MCTVRILRTLHLFTFRVLRTRGLCTVRRLRTRLDQPVYKRDWAKDTGNPHRSACNVRGLMMVMMTQRLEETYRVAGGSMARRQHKDQHRQS
jgi:hypothetical protein